MGKWNSSAAAAWLILALAPLQAQEKKAATLTAMDYIEIQQLVNKYGQDIDTCTNNGYDYADLYTTDGVFIDKYSDDGFKQGRRPASQRARRTGGCVLGRIEGLQGHAVEWLDPFDGRSGDYADGRTAPMADVI